MSTDKTFTASELLLQLDREVAALQCSYELMPSSIPANCCRIVELAQAINERTKDMRKAGRIPDETIPAFLTRQA